ncbi:hypothetical protein Tco_0068729 [Tanacetum coccineum]
MMGDRSLLRNSWAPFALDIIILQQSHAMAIIYMAISLFVMYIMLKVDAILNFILSLFLKWLLRHRLDLVDGLPKFKYEKDHLCSACERGKSKKASHPPKLVPSDHSKLGFTMELKTQSNFKNTSLLQPWQTLCKIFSKCLTTRVTGWDQPP